MKKFSYVCEFMKKDPKNPNKYLSVERHLFIFIVRQERNYMGPSRFVKWWDTSKS